MQARVLAAGLLADYDYSFLRYYGEEGWPTFTGMATDTIPFLAPPFPARAVYE